MEPLSLSLSLSLSTCNIYGKGGSLSDHADWSEKFTRITDLDCYSLINYSIFFKKIVIYT